MVTKASPQSAAITLFSITEKTVSNYNILNVQLNLDRLGAFKNHLNSLGNLDIVI